MNEVAVSADVRRMFHEVYVTQRTEKHCATVKTRIKEVQFRLILFLYIGSFSENQLEHVLKVFLKLFMEIVCCINH